MSIEESLKYIKHFDTIFKTDVMNTIDKNKLILFLKMYEEIKEDLYSQTEEYLSLQKNKASILDDLYKTFNNEQRDKYNSFLELDNKVKEKSNEQIIIFEFILLNLMNM